MKLNTIIVDDDRIFHFLLSVMLNEVKISAKPLCYSEGMEFLTQWREQRETGKGTLLFLDLNMPLINGWEVLDTLQKDEDLKDTYIIIITSSIDPKDRNRALAYPMVIDFLVKPIDIQRLSAIKSLPELAKYFN